MEENVALNTAKQKKFEKSIKGIKKLIKKTNTDPKVDVKDAKNEKRKRKERGLVYLSHIPHGFYEHEMTQYFKQFGVVTNARVIRSRRTGASRGFAFVEFREPAVAQIVAETMNNYLMGKRLIKAAYIPPEKQRPRAMRKYWSSTHNPAAVLRLKMKKAYNADKDKKGDIQRARKILANLTNTKKKLNEMGIKYDFFVPVDMPEELADKLDTEITTVKIVKEKVETQNITHKQKNKKGTEAATKKDVMLNKNNEGTVAKKLKTKATSATKAVEVDIKKEENKKQTCQKVKGLKPLEDFLKVQKDSEDSESSEEFDSDEFEKMFANKDDSTSASEHGSLSEDDGSQSDDERIEDILPPKTNKLVQKIPQKHQQKNNIEQNKKLQSKRKATQKTDVSPKKPKFEKQIKQKKFNTKQKFEKQIKQKKSNTKQFKKKK